MDPMILAIISRTITFFVGYLTGITKKKWNENIGEAAVRHLLLTELNRENYHLLNNITLPCDDGTTQIDHILISIFGIFVIETKNFKGWIFGDKASKYWTQIIFRQKFKFMNPIHQNYKHMKVVQQLLDFIPHDMIHSIVVFTGDAKHKSQLPENVLRLTNLINYISQFREPVISQNRLQFCVGRLMVSRNSISIETDIQHEEYLINKHLNKLL